jgi:cell division protease FtsH
LAARHKRKSIVQEDLLEAVEKVMMWPQKKSSVLSEKEKAIIAYHEVGHALVSKFMPGSDPVHKITMIPRWMSLWTTWYLPEEETKLYTETRFAAELASLYGGHVAEKLKFWEVTTWASNDIERATKMARSMVTQYWMSPLWPIQWEERQGSYAGSDSVTKNHSNEFAKKIDEEVAKILDKAFKKAESILKKYKKEFEALSQLLLEKETITAEEFEGFFKKKA